MLKNAKKSLIFRCFRDVSTRLAMFAHVSNTVFTPKPRSFYAKQTQFQKSQNQPNHLCEKGLWKYVPSRAAAKQTQFQNHRPRTDPASTNMQNKPNFPRHKINLTFYEHKDYRNLRLPGLRKNKPNFEPATRAHPRHWSCGLHGFVDGRRLLTGVRLSVKIHFFVIWL